MKIDSHAGSEQDQDKVGPREPVGVGWIGRDRAAEDGRASGSSCRHGGDEEPHHWSQERDGSNASQDELEEWRVWRTRDDQPSSQRESNGRYQGDDAAGGEH